MSDKEALRAIVHDNLDSLIQRVNAALRRKNLKALEPVLKRLGRGGQLPHWYPKLKSEGVLPNLDGKTIGSVIEMILVAVLETETFVSLGIPALKINPARGIDLPDLDLGVKSPSKNYCTSEPFFSGYERLLGSDHDALILLTDYQDAKMHPPLRLQITKWRYLTKTQIADENLCRLARTHREWLLDLNESWAKKVFRFLAFVNQSDWQAKKLLRLMEHLRDVTRIRELVYGATAEYESKNRELEKKDRPLLSEDDLKALRSIVDIRPIHLGVIDAADNWVVRVQKELGRLPNDNEWNRLKTYPLDGLIGMSFALQWRYNFGRLFGASQVE